jgi:hypothetical protein
MVMHGRTSAQPDETVFLDVAVEHTHVFDADGARRLDTVSVPPQ